MKKTMVYLDNEQYMLLKRVSRSSQKKMSEIIREALSKYFLEKQEQKSEYFSFVGIAKGPPKGRISEKTEEILKEILK